MIFFFWVKRLEYITKKQQQLQTGHKGQSSGPVATSL